MYGETFYGRHTAQHQLQWRQIKFKNQVYFSVFEARWNYKVPRLSWDFEVLLCHDWIRFAQSVWATSRQNLSSELKLKSAISVSEARHLGYKNLGSTCILSRLRTLQTMLILYIRLLCFFVVRMRHNKKEKNERKKKKKERRKRSLMSDNKEALWTCLIIIKYHN